MKKVITILVSVTMISCNGQRNFSKTVEQENQMTEQKVEPMMLPIATAVLDEDEEYLAKYLSSENVNELYDIPVGVMNIYHQGEFGWYEKERTLYGKGTLLHLATFHNLPNSAKILIEKGADVNAKDAEGRTPLQAAVIAYSRNTASVQMILIENKADMNFYIN